MTEMNNALLAEYMLNQEMVAEKLQIKSPYVSNFIRGRGYIPFADWSRLYDYFLELRINLKNQEIER